MDLGKIPEGITCAINSHTPAITIDKRNYVADGTEPEMQCALETLSFPNPPCSFCAVAARQLSGP
jgi:hypothetical protein